MSTHEQKPTSEAAALSDDLPTDRLADELADKAHVLRVAAEHPTRWSAAIAVRQVADFLDTEAKRLREDRAPSATLSEPAPDAETYPNGYVIIDAMDFSDIQYRVREGGMRDDWREDVLMRLGIAEQGGVRTARASVPA